MSSIVGFTLTRGLAPRRRHAALAAQSRALGHFPALVRESLPLGETTLDVWGHAGFDSRIWRAEDGTAAVVVGSPQGPVDWQREARAFLGPEAPLTADLPWDGRTIVARVCEGGRRWDMWTDWVGSIPVYHAQLDEGWIASTFEPVVVAAAEFSSADISVPGLVGLLVDGQFLNDRTLFDGMTTVPADCQASWSADRFEWRRLWTVTPSCQRWEADWNELVDEMHHLGREAIRAALGSQSRWMVPLSGGLDSRWIGAVAVEAGVAPRTCTYGHREATDVVCARRIAKKLGLPWRHVSLGSDYLLTETVPWTDVFGSSMHLHGMYQMAFFRQLRRAPASPVLSGYMGDSLSGYAIAELVAANLGPEPCRLVTDAYHHWTEEEAAGLLTMPAREALAAVSRDTEATLRSLPGAGYQQALLLNIWNRQRRFTGFSAWIADHERSVATPFLSRAYARFCLSLPRAALDGRRLLADVFRRHYPALAAVPGTYAHEPLLLTGQYSRAAPPGQAAAVRLHPGPLPLRPLRDGPGGHARPRLGGALANQGNLGAPRGMGGPGQAD